MNKLGVIISVVALSGCAIGQKIDIRDGSSNLSYRGSGTVAAGVHDQRAYVLSADKKPQFVGLMRGGYGNPFGVTTKSKQPLSSDLEHVLVGELQRAGYSVDAVSVPYAMDDNAAHARVARSGSQRSVLLTVNNLKSDTYVNTGLIYDLTIDVIDTHGNTIASAHTAGKDNLGGSMMNPPGVAKKKTPDAVAAKLAQLLDQPEIRTALKEADASL